MTPEMAEWFQKLRAADPAAQGEAVSALAALGAAGCRTWLRR